MQLTGHTQNKSFDTQVKMAVYSGSRGGKNSNHVHLP